LKTSTIKVVKNLTERENGTPRANRERGKATFQVKKRSGKSGREILQRSKTGKDQERHVRGF